MKKFLALATAFAVISLCAQAQNVGVNKTNPQEQLDVNGNINVDGTIKVNGIDGTAGQMLMKNSSGNMVWANLANEYENYVLFLNSTTWVVPAGVTKILVEAWGGGGGGSCLAGGGGGAFVTGYFTVTPGMNISVNIGTGGSASPCGSTVSNNGNSSYILIGGSTFISAWGGRGSYVTGTATNLGKGGTFNASANFVNYIGMPGSDGEPNRKEYHQVNSTTTHLITYPGAGGDAANTSSSGGNGGAVTTNASTGVVLENITPGSARMPGGGGSGHYNNLGSTNCNGAPGMIRILY